MNKKQHNNDDGAVDFIYNENGKPCSPKKYKLTSSRNYVISNHTVFN